MSYFNIIKLEGLSETYCFNEPKRHTGIFNGILTGQSRTYSKLLITYVEDKAERGLLLNAIETMPAVSKKAKWAQKWIDSNASLATRIIAFNIVEELFFSGSFCAIFYFADLGMLQGLCMSNAFISRDEGLHCEFGKLLYNKYIVNKLSQEEIDELINEAVDIEKEFILEALPCELLGMNAEMMSEYIEYIAHRLVSQLGYTSKFKNAKSTFGFMDKIALQTQTQFFDKRVSEYRKKKTVEKQSIENQVINFEADF